MVTIRHYYVGHSYMGTNFTYDSPCWAALAFNSKTERDNWLIDHEYKNGNIVAEVIDRRTAFKIAGINSMYPDFYVEKNTEFPRVQACPAGVYKKGVYAESDFRRVGA